MNTDSRRSDTRAGLNALAAIILAVALVACGSLLSRPRQGWNPSYGPVVPHDKFPTDCALCHIGGSWNKIRTDFSFDHEAKTGVPLNAAHTKAACLLCHNDRGPAAEFAARGCSGCHEDIHRGQLGVNCKDCHNEDTWQPLGAVAQHNRTRFQLVGAHAAAACFRCHPGASAGNFAGADPACVTCHQADLARAVSPDHAAQGWVNDCQRCHIATTWNSARFAHPSSFPLTGGHSGHDCASCLQGGIYTGLFTACDSCHMPDYQATTNPNHVSAGYSTSCNSCHNTIRWQGATATHPATFPLTGGHAGRTCTDCHVGGVYSGRSTACNSCHMPAYQGTTNPNHTQAAFSTTCNTCHTTNTWSGATFTHISSFPLTGGHSGRTCNACHQSGVYHGLSSACSSCHQAQYQATTNPNHTAAGFPTTCNSCHNTTTWTGATFSHAFPITTGRHVFSCNQCHLNPTNFQTFSCIDCHTHNQVDTQGHHNGVNGYQWVSQACLNCHPQGRR